MSLQKQAATVTATVGKLAQYASFKTLCHHHHEGVPFPSERVLHEIVDICRALMFPGFFGHAKINADTINYHIGVQTERLYELVSRQVMAGLGFECGCEDVHAIERLHQEAEEITVQFITFLPELRRLLATDVEATYNGDPASESYGEVVFCYPAIRAISNHRIAHKLLQLGVPLIPRMISEMAHSETGIDIHPAATIGSHFTIDHGTGVVIGATAIIGNNVKIYQGVTLGAKSFPLDENGNPIKGVPRHPIIGNDVVIYSNATILGRITIGEGAVIGGNIWVTQDVESGAKIMQSLK